MSGSDNWANRRAGRPRFASPTARRDPRAELSQLAGELGPDEVRVLVFVARRLAEGQRCYGRLDVERDARDFERERAEELADALVYGARAELKRQVTRP
ncbi:MAG: hypothetical protein IT373_11955 [Polyangiaceae bacterium]|nr:hypothetical protein [Polyangiaceae bacterium]